MDAQQSKGGGDGDKLCLARAAGGIKAASRGAGGFLATDVFCTGCKLDWSIYSSRCIGVSDCQVLGSPLEVDGCIVRSALVDALIWRTGALCSRERCTVAV
jgi:hypothetical protein